MRHAKLYPISNLFFCLLFIVFFIKPSIADDQNNICSEDVNVNNRPIFQVKLNVCNFETRPVEVYAIKMAMSPDFGDNDRLCHKGDEDRKFVTSTDRNGRKLLLIERLHRTEVSIRLFFLRIDKSDTPSEQNVAKNAIVFELTILECNDVIWQTWAVAVVSSLCIILMSSLAIMLILYHQQKSKIGSSSDEDNRADDLSYQPDLRDNTFINPRRTSSYEFSSLSRHSGSTLERQEI